MCSHQPTCDKEYNSRVCYTFGDTCAQSRHCFMTGEHCSKQGNIQKERDRLHKTKTVEVYRAESDPEGKKRNAVDQITAINAFVVMNFSDMSDVMYKWRLKTFIESLAKYFYFDPNRKYLYCTAEADAKMPDGTRAVSEIRVIRADSDPSSNYVICNRICQQMQLADLVIVDVSSQNTNVFYEFGMAVALGKLILPICFSEAFYKKDDSLVRQYQGKPEEHHIACYPWRKTLFEFYGILYKNAEEDHLSDSAKENEDPLAGTTHYLSFEQVTDLDKGFKSDIIYNRFPYTECVNKSDEPVGFQIYNALRSTYNSAISSNNTLVVYTMDGFLNENQAGRCIVNFYNYITVQMKKQQCFRGDRAGVLAQDNSIVEEDKDAKERVHFLYKVAEIIHIGVNQATYTALNERIKTEEFLTVPQCMRDESPDISPVDYTIPSGSKSDSSKWVILPQQKKDMTVFIKKHIRNRGLLIYPNYPVYVNRFQTTQPDLLDPVEIGGENSIRFFCLYYVMLRNLKYTNEVVVDITGTDTQQLFWLGAAHGADVYAITVKHELTDVERKKKEEHPEIYGAKGIERSIFDVAGLWTAILHSYDTEGFYQQLAMAQMGIERHSKLVMKDGDDFDARIQELIKSFQYDSEVNKINSLLKEKRDVAARELESYYRQRFWDEMLQTNRIKIYLPKVNKKKRSKVSEWDILAAAQMSTYLSKRTVIGKYRIVPLLRGKKDPEAKDWNFITVCEKVAPLGMTIAECIKQNVCMMSNKVEETAADIQKLPGRQSARLTLLHDQTDGQDLYRVEINGETGPATVALATLFVDYDQKKEIFKKEPASNQLCLLQERIREGFLKHYLERLSEELNKAPLKIKSEKQLEFDNLPDAGDSEKFHQKTRYYSLVKHSIAIYLSTVLYRYFLPLLSGDDIDRICNSAEYYVNSVKAENLSPFAIHYQACKGDPDYDTVIADESVENAGNTVLEVLRSMLSHFYGVTADYYAVIQGNSDDGENDRKILALEEKSDSVRCLFSFE